MCLDPGNVIFGVFIPYNSSRAVGARQKYTFNGNNLKSAYIGPVTRKVEGIENLQYSKKAVISKLKKKNTML